MATPAQSRPSSSSSTPAPQQGNPLVQSYLAWSERTPYITRITTVVLCILYIISFFVNLEYYLTNVTKYSLMRFQVFRLVTSPFAGNSFFMIILVLLTYPSLGMKMEVSMGSSAFLLVLLALDFLVNLTFALTCLFLYLGGLTLAASWTCGDFWLIIFALLTIDCLQEPDAPRRLLFVPWDIPSKYMPLLLYAIICLFGGPALGYALSIGVGFLYSRGYLDRLKPSSRTCEQFEAEGGCLRSVSRLPGYVLAGTLGHDSWVPVNQNQDPMSRERLLGQASAERGVGRAAGLGGAGPATGGATGGLPHAPFPGSARKLADGPAVVEAVPVAEAAPSSFFSFAPSAPPLSTLSSHGNEVLSREQMAARRLAALEAGNRTSSSSSSSSTGTTTGATAATGASSGGGGRPTVS